MKKTMKKQTKKPAARTATKPTGVPVSKTVARPLVPAVPPPADPEEARINREAAAAVIEGRRHMRLAEQYRLKSGTPYTGEDEQLVGSTFHDREALRVWGGLAEEEEAAAERCVEELRRAQGELNDLRKLKSQQDHTAALREHAAALRASNTPPPSSSPSEPAPGHSKPACVKWYQDYESIAFANGDEYEVTARSIWKDVLFALLAPDDPEGWAELDEGWEDSFKGSGVKSHLKELKQKHIESEAKAKRTRGTHRFRLV